MSRVCGHVIDSIFNLFSGKQDVTENLHCIDLLPVGSYFSLKFCTDRIATDNEGARVKRFFKQRSDSEIEIGTQFLRSMKMCYQRLPKFETDVPF